MPIGNWTDVNAKTTEYIVPKLYDYIFMSSPLLTRLRTRNNVVFNGGLYIQTPFFYDRLNGGSYAKGADFSQIVRPGATAGTGIDPVQTDAALTLGIKNYVVNVAIEGADAILEAGPYTVMSTSQSKLINAAGTMAKQLATDIFKGGTGTGNDSPTTSVDGLLNACSNGAAYPGSFSTATAVALRTYAGVDRTQMLDIDTGATIAAGTNNKGLNGGITQSAAVGTITANELQNAYGMATFGNEQPDLIVTSQSIWNQIANNALLIRRYQKEDIDVCQIGFAALQFNGAAIVVDQYAPQNVAWFLNTKYLQFYTSKLPKYAFGWSGWKHAQGNDNQVAQYFWSGNLMNNNPRLFSVIDAS